MCRIEKMIKVAATEATGADHAIYHLGAVIIKGGKIIGSGCNTAIRHAEINALRSVHSSPRGATMIVVRTTPTGFAMAKPCSNCHEALLKAGIRKVYYTTREGVKKMKLTES